MKKQVRNWIQIMALIPGIFLCFVGCQSAQPQPDIPLIHSSSIASGAEADRSEESGETDTQEVVQEPESAGEETGEAHVPEEEPVSEPEEISFVISAAGDVTMGNYKGQGYDGTFMQTYEQEEDKSYFFRNVESYFCEDDLSIVNLEGTLTFSENFAEGRTYNIKGDPEYAYLLPAASVEAVSFANNHKNDYGPEGISDTVNALEEAGVLYAYEDITGMYEKDGIRVGWVSVNETSMNKGVEKYLENGIAKLKEEGANLILACCHWGIEREHYPEDYQKELGRKCIDWGADLVIGHHPHVLQGIDSYQGKYIIYSLGNFCFGANKNPSDKDTMIFQQTFTFRKENSAGAESDSTWILLPDREARIIPCSISSVTTRNNYQPTPLTGEDAERVIGRINQYSGEFGVTADSEGKLTVK